MLCLSFKILKCFVIYILLLSTQSKKIQQQQKGFDEITNMEKYMLCFRGKKHPLNSRLNGSHAFSREKLTAKFRRELVYYPDQRLANF